jgi:hypothetical protein
MPGKILKIKTGYNPNSSSIGVDMVIFFTAGAAITVLFNAMAAVLCSAKIGMEAHPVQPETDAVLIEEPQCPQ